MKLSVTADTHFLSMREWEKENEIRDISAKMGNADVIAFAGDISESYEGYDQFFSGLKKMKMPKFAVLGNHDLWTKSGNSLDKINIYRDICKKNGVHLLDKAPAIVGNVGFVGNVGWYDFRFGEKINEKRCYEDCLDEVLEIIRPDRQTERKKLRDFTRNDFSARRYRRMNGKGGLGWNDVNYIKMPFSDEDFTLIQVQKLEDHLRYLSDKVDQIVYISHHVPLGEVMEYMPSEHPIIDAYQGSPLLGDIAKRFDKVKTIINGHTHTPHSDKFGEISYYDTSRVITHIKL